jgi:hypothetical protein
MGGHPVTDLEEAGKRLGLALLAVVLVVSMSLSGYVPGQGPVEPAAANHQCDTVSYAFAGMSAGVSAISEATGRSALGCDVFHDETNAQRVKEAEEQQSKVDIYSAAQGDKSTRETFQATSNNYIQDSDSIAWMKAEAAIAEAFENGKSKSQAKTEARQAIASYYSVKQINLLKNWNTTIITADYLLNRSKQEGFGSDYVTANCHGECTYSSYKEEFRGTGSPETVTLVNSSTRTSVTADMRGNGYNGPFQNDISVDEGEWQYEQNTNTASHTATIDGIKVRKPNDNYDNLTYVKFQTYADQWAEIEQRNNHLQDEAENFTEAIWTDLQDGNINSSDVLSRTTTMYEYGTDSAGNGTYYDHVAATAGLGLPTADLNETGQMTVTDGGGTTHEGLVFANRSESWEAGETYNPDNMSGPVILATKDGQKKQLDRPFTIESATDTEGNSRSSVPVKDYSYQTADTSELQEKYDRLLNLNRQLEERQEEAAEGGGGGGGGGSSGGGTIPDWLTATYFGIPLWAIAAVLLVALVLIGGDN